MHIAPELGDSLYKITSYDEHTVSINGQSYEKPCLLSPAQLIYPWEVSGLPQLSLIELEPALELKPQLIIFGTGVHWHMLAPALYAALQQRGVGVEVMQTAAACRTFNLLQEEGRQVVAALWPPDYLPT